MRTDFDAIVIGARAAGAATAMLLARGGARVLLVDRDAPGTDTPFTHALMRGAVMQLARWGLLPRILDAGTPPVRQTVFGYGPDRIEIAIKPGPGFDALAAPRRTVLDPILVAAAAEAGAVVRHRTALTGITLGRGGRVTGATLTGPDGERTLRADLVIGADGRRSSLARMVGAAETVSGRHFAASIYGHVPGLANLGYRWLYGAGVAAGAIPTNGGMHVVFVTVPPERYAAMRGALAPALHATLAEVDPALAAAVAANGLVSRPVGFAGAPGFLRRSHGPGWALVGDAGYFKDPITAHGITDALRDAEMLARGVLAGDPLALYEETRDALSLPLFRVTEAIAALPSDMDHLQSLHRAFAEAMKPELAWLAAMPAPAAEAA